MDLSDRKFILCSLFSLITTQREVWGTLLTAVKNWSRLLFYFTPNTHCKRLLLQKQQYPIYAYLETALTENDRGCQELHGQRLLCI